MLGIVPLHRRFEIIEDVLLGLEVLGRIKRP
jgi:hypothetical protein